ncbi:MAG: hypothetical protein KVP17_002896 [Porospora cf. gigantea B]|uniref:uncharacterized protein n=1 Tax=Porospora cf. gigantea B TaxID=2853592 RepID=UPI0035719D85|nr:MAG: hypothetical protein KVP17_002896 [Porospora cf. gigantea B]
MALDSSDLALQIDFAEGSVTQSQTPDCTESLPYEPRRPPPPGAREGWAWIKEYLSDLDKPATEYFWQLSNVWVWIRSEVDLLVEGIDEREMLHTTEQVRRFSQPTKPL